MYGWQIRSIETDETGAVTHIWFEFPESPDGLKDQEKGCSIHPANRISHTAVPIARRTSTLYI